MAGNPHDSSIGSLVMSLTYPCPVQEKLAKISKEKEEQVKLQAPFPVFHSQHSEGSALRLTKTRLQQNSNGGNAMSKRNM